jgi:hypothetical protein
MGESAGLYLSPARAGPAYEKVSSEGGMGTPHCQAVSAPEIRQTCSVRSNVLGLLVAAEKSV